MDSKDSYSQQLMLCFPNLALKGLMCSVPPKEYPT